MTEQAERERVRVSATAIKGRIFAFLDRVFVPREIHLRSNDAVKFIRLSSRLQKSIAIGVLVVAVWIGASTSGVIFMGSLLNSKSADTSTALAKKDEEIERQKLAYFELLAEVSEYHNQFAEITESLEKNQDLLLSLLSNGRVAPKELAAIQEELKSSSTERARVVIAREGLREKLQKFENDLLKIAGRSSELKSQVAQIQDTLKNTEAGRREVVKARERLGRKLQNVETTLASTLDEKQGLETDIAELSRSLDESRSNFDSAIAQSNAARANHFAAQALVEARIAALNSRLSANGERREVLNAELDSTKQSLAEMEGRADRFAEENGQLKSQVADLREEMGEVKDAQSTVVRRLTERTKLGIEAMERTVAMTGLDLDNLLSDAQSRLDGQGGPFVPADHEGDSESDREYESAMSLLDVQINRWAALQEVVSILPLAPPLDQYRISSTFGKRRDPINGRTAVHNGLDFSARPGVSVYATAPGKIVYAGWRGRFGRFVEIDHGNGIRTRYAHLRKIFVRKGDTVANRDKIALLGTSGRSTGPHVHYEVMFKGRAVDPRKFLQAGKHIFKS